jgi:hypothetical protein
MTDEPYNEDHKEIGTEVNSGYQKLSDEIKDHMSEDEWLWLSDREKLELEDVWCEPDDAEDIDDLFY